MGILTLDCEDRSDRFGDFVTFQCLHLQTRPRRIALPSWSSASRWDTTSSYFVIWPWTEIEKNEKGKKTLVLLLSVFDADVPLMGRLYSCLQTVQLKIEKALLPWKPVIYFACFVSTSCRIARWWSWRHQPLQPMRSLVLVGSGCRGLQVREGRGVIEMPMFWAFLGRESNAKEP